MQAQNLETNEMENFGSKFDWLVFDFCVKLLNPLSSATPPNLRPNLGPEKGTQVSWKRSPNTGRKRAAAEKVYNPKREIDALEGVLANVHGEQTLPEVADSKDVESRQLFQSWLHEESNLKDSPAGQIEASACSHSAGEMAVCRETVKKRQRNEIRRESKKNRTEMTSNRVDKNHDGNLLKILDQLQNNIAPSLK